MNDARLAGRFSLRDLQDDISSFAPDLRIGTIAVCCGIRGMVGNSRARWRTTASISVEQTEGFVLTQRAGGGCAAAFENPSKSPPQYGVVSETRFQGC